MFKNHKTLVFCLTLSVLVAGTADAITQIEIDPGTPGEAAQDFDFGLVDLDPDGLLQVTFTDNKTLEWDAGSHFWSSPGFPLNVNYFGFFLDSNLDAISTAAFAGRTPGEGGDFELPIAIAALEEDGVFSGLLFSFSGEAQGGLDLDWEWGSDAPRVVPIPAAAWLFGSALLGLVGMARRKRAA